MILFELVDRNTWNYTIVYKNSSETTIKKT